jgi:hypothetical protein
MILSQDDKLLIHGFFSRSQAQEIHTRGTEPPMGGPAIPDQAARACLVKPRIMSGHRAAGHVEDLHLYRTWPTKGEIYLHRAACRQRSYKEDLESRAGQRSPLLGF